MIATFLIKKKSAYLKLEQLKEVVKNYYIN